MRNSYLPSTFIGFDELLTFLTPQHTFPPYNVEQQTLVADNGDALTKYVITLAVAGYTKEELSVEKKKSLLTISGSKTQTSDSLVPAFIHKGIALRDFKRTFEIMSFLEVEGVTYENGLLSITLVKNEPEEEKTTKLDIK